MRLDGLIYIMGKSLAHSKSCVLMHRLLLDLFSARNLSRICWKMSHNHLLNLACYQVYLELLILNWRGYWRYIAIISIKSLIRSSKKNHWLNRLIQWTQTVSEVYHIEGVLSIGRIFVGSVFISTKETNKIYLQITLKSTILTPPSFNPSLDYSSSKKTSNYLHIATSNQNSSSRLFHDKVL